MKSIWMFKPRLHFKLRTARISLKKNRKPQNIKNSTTKESNEASICSSKGEMDTKETQTWITWTEDKKKYLDVSYAQLHSSPFVFRHDSRFCLVLVDAKKPREHISWKLNKQ